MRADLQYVKRRFNEFNLRYFNCELPAIGVGISNASSSLGQFVFPRNYPASAPRGVGECRIRISQRFDLPQQDIDDTIAHEMIHYYIWYKKLEDTSAHGPVFRQWMERLNSTGERHITVSHHATREQRESGQKCRSNYICVSRWKNHPLAVTVCARTRIFEIYKIFRSHPDFVSMQWFWSMDPWFSRFPIARSAKIWPLTEENFSRYFATAVECECDGDVFRPVKKAGKS